MVTIPESMDELVYFSNRTIKDGKAMAWVYRQDCPECGKAKMGKPVEKGKVKTRALEYKCPECDHVVEKQEYEDTLTCEVAYTCPECSHKGEDEAPFKRKKVKIVDESGKEKKVEAVPFQCQKCKASILITKKLK